MALTKAEAAKLTQDLLVRGVIETVIKESSVLANLPFMDVVGTAVTYNKENAMAAAAFYAVGDTITEGTTTFTQATKALSIIIRDAQVDQFLQRSYANPNDQTVEQIKEAAKALAHKYTDTFFNGSVSGDANSFDGLITTLTGGTQEQSLGTNGAALTLDFMDQGVDLVKPGKPEAIFMSKRSRRKLKSLRRASGATLETSMNQFGEQVDMYDGIPVYADDFINDAETQGSSAVASSIFFVKWGFDGIMGLENGGITIEPVGALETKDAHKWRIKWYASMVNFKPTGVARLFGVL